MKVWVVHSINWGFGGYVMAVFSTKEDAIAWREIKDPPKYYGTHPCYDTEVEDWEVDEFVETLHH